MKLESKFIKADDMRAFGEIFCDGYELTGSFTLDDIFGFIEKTKASHPDDVLFATLDDFGQACYTFGHACGSHLKESSDKEFPWPDLPPKQRFLKRKAYFEEGLKETNFNSILGQRFWCDANADSPSLMLTPKLPRENKSYVQIVPVKHAYESIIAFPNGYFSDDYSPFENYRLAEYLETKHDIKMFGIGANHIGFNSKLPLQGERLKDVAKFFASLFPSEDPEPSVGTISIILCDQTVFYFCYAER